MRPRLTKLCIVLLILTGLTGVAEAQSIPRLISYQGRLMSDSGAPVSDAAYTVEFSLYTDSVAGSSVWIESASVTTINGFFTHLLGSTVPLQSDIFSINAFLFLNIRLNGENVMPRAQLVSVPYAQAAANLIAADSADSAAFSTDANAHKLIIFGSGSEDSAIILSGTLQGDSSVVLPVDAINSDEMLNEPGLSTGSSIIRRTLITGTMSDLVTVNIKIPEDGYIVLQGKCYAILSGTLGANSTRIQIDDEAGGPSHFPYYTIAGLGGYVNTDENYFPVYVIRTYFATAGAYQFRMEGMAMNLPPALAETWDHLLNATYYPTSYYGVKAITTEPGNNPTARMLERRSDDSSLIYYEVDLTKEEK